ncbi:MAG: LysR family transcriptional regulator [Myxococcota bacterium]
MKGRPDLLGKASVFAAVVRAGSFAAGARTMGLARSTASEHVASLENALGVRLLERTTRTLRLTEEGELLFERIDRAMRDWDDARAALQERGDEPAGLLRVTAPGGLASSVVGPICGQLMAAHERVEVELVVDDALRDLIADRIDIAIRMAPLTDSSLICRKLGATRTIVVGGGRQLAQVDEAAGLDGLTRHPWVSHGAVSSTEVHLHDTEGTVHVIHPRNRSEGSNGEGQAALVAAGCGLALMPELLVRGAVEAGTLTHVYPAWHGREIPIYALYSRSELTPPRITRFIELAVEHLGGARLR